MLSIDYMAKRKAVEGASESKSKSQGSRKSVEIDATDRVAIVSRLCTIKGVAKMGLARTLKALHDKDLLNDSLVSATSLQGYQRQVQKAIEKEALALCPPTFRHPVRRVAPTNARRVFGT